MRKKNGIVLVILQLLLAVICGFTAYDAIKDFIMYDGAQMLRKVCGVIIFIGACLLGVYSLACVRKVISNTRKNFMPLFASSLVIFACVDLICKFLGLFEDLFITKINYVADAGNYFFTAANVKEMMLSVGIALILFAYVAYAFARAELTAKRRDAEFSLLLKDMDRISIGDIEAEERFIELAWRYYEKWNFVPGAEIPEKFKQICAIADRKGLKEVVKIRKD